MCEPATARIQPRRPRGIRSWQRISEGSVGTTKTIAAGVEAHAYRRHTFSVVQHDESSTVMRRVGRGREFVMRAVPIAALFFFAVFFAVTPSARAQPSNVCDYLPSGMQKDGPESALGVDRCASVDPGSTADNYKPIIVIKHFATTAYAEYSLQVSVQMGIGWQGSSGYGDSTLACSGSDAACRWPGTTKGILFRRGCYLVQSGWNASTEQKMRTYLGQIDQRLQSAPCGGGQAKPAATVPPSPGNALGVTLQCEHEFPDPGLAKCSAQPVNPRPNASIAYDWTFDSAAQSGTGAELDLAGIKPGPHTAAVTARDTNNNLTSDQETLSFTKGAPAPTAPTAPPLGSSNRAAPASPPDASSNVPNLPSRGPNIDASTLIGGIVGTGVVLGAAVGIARRRRNGRGSPAAPFVPPVRRPAAPAADPTPQTPTSDTPVAPAVSSQQPQSTEVLWLTADPPTLTVHGASQDAVQVRITAFKAVNDVVSDASAEVNVTVQARAGDKHLIVERIDNLTYMVKGAHVGVLPHDCTLTVSGVSQKTGRVALPAYIAVRITPAKVEARIGVIKKGFVYQELVATIPDVCRTVVGSVASIDPSDFFDSQLRDFGADYGLDGSASATSQQPVASARCFFSIRLDGGDWTEPKPATTDEQGRFRFYLLRQFSELLGTAVEYQLPVSIQLLVNSEVKTSLRSYLLESDAFARQTSSVIEGAFPGDSPLADARSQCLDYPRRFFDQLCAGSEDEYGRLLGALNLLRGTIIFASKYRAGFKDQRAQLNVIADDVYGPIIDVILALPISTGILKWLMGERILLKKLGIALWTPREIILAIARKLVKIPGGKTALWLSLLPFRAGRYVFRGSLKQLLAWYPRVLELAAQVGVTPSYVEAMAAELAAGGTSEAGEAAIANLKEGCSNETEVMVASAFGEVARELLSFGFALKNLLFTLAHVFLLLTALVIKITAAGIIAPMAALGYEGAREFFAEVMDSLAGWYPNVYASVADWLESFRRSDTQQNPRKSFCDSILDKVWSLDDMDRVLARGLDTAYANSVRLQLSDDWLAAISRTSKKEVVLMNEWTRDYTKGYTGEGADRTDVWGWVTIGEVLTPWVETIAKLIQIFCFCWAVIIEASAKLALRLGLTLSGATLPEGPLGLTSWTDLIADLARAVFRVGVFGIEMLKLKALYDLFPDRVKDLYSQT